MHYNDEILSIKWHQNKNLLNGLRSKNIPIPFSCGGEGVCTTCRVIVLNGEVTARTPLEAERAEERGFKPNERLSCQCKAIGSEIELIVP